MYIDMVFVLYLRNYVDHAIGDREGEWWGHAPLPYFSTKMQFHMAFLDHRITKSCKVAKTSTKI